MVKHVIKLFLFVLIVSYIISGLWNYFLGGVLFHLNGMVIFLIITVIDFSYILREVYNASLEINSYKVKQTTYEPSRY